jgi:hypothetical protein
MKRDGREPPTLGVPINPVPDAIEFPGTLDNGGFESGIAPWAIFGSRVEMTSERARSGAHSLVQLGEGGFIFQEVATRPGHQYRVSVWALRSCTSPNSQGTLYVHDGDGRAAVTGVASSFPCEQWTEVSTVYRANSSGEARIHLTNAGGPVYWDDVEVTPLAK